MGNPECQHESNESFTLGDLNESFDNIDGYGIAYTLGKYLFKNYDNDFLLELVHDNSKLEGVINELINQKKH